MRPLARTVASSALALLVLLAWPSVAAAQEEGNVRGRLRIDVAGTRLTDAGPIVVYLEPLDGTPAPLPPATVRKVHQKDARFSPRFLVVAAGQSVAMPNDDGIYHNVFSYSTPNDFDLGLYPSGESRKVTFRHPGVVRTYCSIHESMSGTIFVAPTRHHALVGANGEFAIRGVAPGRYRLRSWCDRLPASSREVQVQPGQDASVELVIGASRP
jgi:plastocyanin